MTEVARALSELLANEHAWREHSAKDVQRQLRAACGRRWDRSPAVYLATRAFVDALTRPNAAERDYAPEVRMYVNARFASHRVLRRKGLLAALEQVNRPLKVVENLEGFDYLEGMS